MVSDDRYTVRCASPMLLGTIPQALLRSGLLLGQTMVMLLIATVLGTEQGQPASLSPANTI